MSALCREEVHPLLDGGIGLVICPLDVGWRFGGLCGAVMKQRVGQWPADALVEEDEHGGDPLTLSVSR